MPSRWAIKKDESSFRALWHSSRGPFHLGLRVVFPKGLGRRLGSARNEGLEPPRRRRIPTWTPFLTISALPYFSSIQKSENKYKKIQ